MTNTLDGRIKAKQTILQRDPDFYRNIARRKRPNSKGGSFNDRDFARACGKISKRKNT